MAAIDLPRPESQNIVEVLRTLMIYYALPLWSSEVGIRWPVALSKSWIARAGRTARPSGASAFKRDRFIVSPKPLNWAGIQKAAKSQ